MGGFNMLFTKEEKEVLNSILNKHLLEIENDEVLPGKTAEDFGIEVKYSEVLKSILKKIE
jgi:hypothetical protein